MNAKLLWEVYASGELADIGVTELPETPGSVWIAFSEPLTGPLLLLGYTAPAEDGEPHRNEDKPSVPS